MYSNADRLDIADGRITQEMNLSTAYVDGVMDNLSPRLRYSRDLQYYVPWQTFSLSLIGRQATGSQAPLWFDAAKGVHTGNEITSGYAAFDASRPAFHVEYRPNAKGELPIRVFHPLALPADGPLGSGTLVHEGVMPINLSLLNRNDQVLVEGSE